VLDEGAMESNHIIFEIEEKIGVASFNRPEKGNAFDWTTIKEMEGILYTVEHDEGIRGMILNHA